MFRFTVILSLAASVTAENWLRKNTAASDAQIRFAIENKYDSTGPGSQTPEYAYKTYQTLDEALIAYINDPDTQLPEIEKNKALHKLMRPVYNSIPRYQPKTVDEYTGYKPPPKDQNIVEYAAYGPQSLHTNTVVNDYTGWKPFHLVNPNKPFQDVSYYKPRPPPASASSVNTEQYNNNHLQPSDDPFTKERYTRLEKEDFDPNPQYSFSYGVHDKGTGDSKSAHETRDGGAVRGFYTFLDADGKQRTVHYTADDKHGFRASVQRTRTNTQ